MATRYEVKCINKSNRYDPHERILSIGGVNGTPWKISEQRAIQGIEGGEWAFYVSKDGRVVDVIIAQRHGRKYLKTVPDRDQPDNLLSLPECP